MKLDALTSRVRSVPSFSTSRSRTAPVAVTKRCRLQSSATVHRRRLRTSHFKPVYSGRPFAASVTVDDRDQLLRQLTDALILTSFACKAQSLFALDCLVHTVRTLYEEGCTISELQVLLTVKPFECGATILKDAEQDILLSWASLVMLTLHKMEIPHPSSSSLDEIVGKGGMKMKPFVEQVIAMFRSGTDIKKLLEIQEEASSREEQTELVELMHRNSIIVTLAATACQEDTQSTEDSPSDAMRFVSSFCGERSAQGTALKALIAFMGATLGSIFCIDRFISAVTGGYEDGLEARDLVNSVTDEEYEQACKALPVLDAETQGIAAGISRQQFGRWVSIVFMTLAQSGLGHQLATVSSGWAWPFDITDDSHVFEMTRLSSFVTNSLRRVTAEDTEPPLDLSERLKDVPDMLQYLPKYKEEAAKKKVEEYGSLLVAVEDEELRQTSPTALAFWQMIFLVHLTHRKFLASVEEREQQELDASS